MRVIVTVSDFDSALLSDAAGASGQTGSVTSYRINNKQVKETHICYLNSAEVILFNMNSVYD